jgi:hypothetical protein
VRGGGRGGRGGRGGGPCEEDIERFDVTVDHTISVAVRERL